MNVTKLLISLCRLCVVVALAMTLHHFCAAKTKGFRPYLILSNLPNDPRWEVPPLTAEEQKQIDALLDQSFTFAGSGGWCYAFLGEDQHTILKFYRHDHLRLSNILKDFSLQKLLLKSTPLPLGTTYFQEFNFTSCTLMYKEAKERTGLLYVHLNKTSSLHKPVIIIDNIGIKHTVDLDSTEFVVQKRADLLIPHLNRLAKEKKTEQAKRCLDDVIDCLLTLFKRGVRDYDLSFRNNFGFTEDGAIALDLSSFGFDESLKNPGEYRKELVLKTRRLSRFLKKNHTDLYTYFENRLSDILEKG